MATEVSQGAVLGLTDNNGPTSVSMAAVLTLGSINVPTEVPQLATLVLVDEGIPLRIVEGAVLALVLDEPCSSRWCQCWLLERLDGVEFAFTSHDQPLEFLGRTFTPCNSLTPSATEAATDLGSIGNMELNGVVSDDSITEFDLFAGKFDGCRVQVFEVPWGGGTDSAIRLAAGRTGAISQGRDGFGAEVLGLGAQMQQQAITQVVAPGCRFVFGDARCTKDLAALTVASSVSGVATTASSRIFAASSLAGAFAADYFTLGVVTFTTGANAGLRSEIKEFDAVTGSFVLWTAMAAPIVAGDAFTASPGCDLAKATCKDKWANLINFGGFPDVPGDDATAAVPDAKY